MTMVEETEISLSTEKPRHCPACGARVATKATTCIMCGATLAEEEVEQEEEEPRQGLPVWANVFIVVGLALVILAAGGFGFYALLTSESEYPTPTITPTRTPTATLTPTPTQTPTPTSIPTPVPPRVHQVGTGETFIVIAQEYDITTEELVALNPDVDPDVLQVGQILLIPPATSAEADSMPEPGDPTPTPSDFIIHIIVSGETLSEIAELYGVPLSAIRAANDLPIGDDTIRINEALLIPIGTPTPTPTPTVDPNVTPTPVPPYVAPPLLSPPDGAVFVGGDEVILLQWASVGVLRGDEWYELILSQPPGGVVSETMHTRTTAWRVPLDLLPDANTDARDFRWRVQAVREAWDRSGALVYEGAGSPSEARTFTWLAPTPTPGPSPTPVP